MKERFEDKEPDHTAEYLSGAPIEFTHPSIKNYLLATLGYIWGDVVRWIKFVQGD